MALLLRFAPFRVNFEAQIDNIEITMTRNRANRKTSEGKVRSGATSLYAANTAEQCLQQLKSG